MAATTTTNQQSCHETIKTCWKRSRQRGRFSRQPMLSNLLNQISRYSTLLHHNFNHHPSSNLNHHLASMPNYPPLPEAGRETEQLLRPSLQEGTRTTRDHAVAIRCCGLCRPSAPLWPPCCKVRTCNKYSTNTSKIMIDWLISSSNCLFLLLKAAPPMHLQWWRVFPPVAPGGSPVDEVARCHLLTSTENESKERSRCVLQSPVNPQFIHQDHHITIHGFLKMSNQKNLGPSHQSNKRSASTTLIQECRRTWLQKTLLHTPNQSQNQRKTMVAWQWWCHVHTMTNSIDWELSK